MPVKILKLYRCALKQKLNLTCEDLNGVYRVTARKPMFGLGTTVVDIITLRSDDELSVWRVGNPV